MRDNSLKTERSISPLQLLVVLLLFSFLIAAQAIGQTQFVCTSQPDTMSTPSATVVSRPASMDCGEASWSYTNKFTIQDTFIPIANDPVITVKVTLHIFRKSDGTGTWQPSDVPTIKNLMETVVHSSPPNNVLSDNTDRYSVPRSANYSVTGVTYPTTVTDSKIQYELTNIYFWDDDQCYNTDGFTSNWARNWLSAYHPNEFREGMPLVITNAQSTPYVKHFPGLGPVVYIGLLDTAFVRTELRHEIGHAFGLGHPYPSGELEQVTNTPFYYHPCGSQNYLSDVFIPNNPLCNNPAPNPPVPGYVPNTCGSCYEWWYFSNNIMHNTSSQNRWMSFKQMGRRIMYMHMDGPKNIYVRQWAKDMSSNHLNPWIITQNETWDFDIQMYKDIVIRPGVTLIIKCKVAMPIQGNIVVEKGGRLIIDGGLVTTWCKSGLWGSIQVAGDPSGDQSINATTGYANYQGLLNVINGGTLSLSGTAVTNYRTDANNNILWGTVGGIVQTNNANFINNRRDAEFLAYGPQISQSRFINTQFKTTGSINGSIPPFAHVTMWGIRGVQFWGCNFEYAAGSLYSAHGMGIYSGDAAYTVNQYCATPACTSPIVSTFKNLDRGVMSPNFNPVAGSASIYNSQFYDNYPDAVYLHNMNYAIVDKNYVRTPNTTPIGSGIYLNTCKQYAVKNNTLYQQGSPQVYPAIYAFNSQAGAHQIYRNNFNNFWSGVNAVNNNSGLANTTDGLLINCNDFTPGKCKYDIAVLGTGTGANMPTIKSIQGVILGNAQQAVRNKYFANCSNQNEWFVANNSTKQIIHYSSANAGGIITQPLPQPSCSNTLVVISTAPFQLNYPTDCVENPSSSGGGSGGTGSGSTSGTNPPQRLININQYIRDLQTSGGDPFELEAAVSAKIKWYLEDTLVSSIDSVISILAANPGHMDDADLQLVFAYMTKGDYTHATTYANALGSARADWKALMLRLISISQETDKIYSVNRTSTGHKAFLENYANTEGKDGQGIAQALLKFVCDISYTEPRPLPEEEGGGERTFNGQNNIDAHAAGGSQITVYPNPTQNGITVQCQLKDEETGTVKVELKDLLGKIIYTNFIGSTNEQYISLKGLSNGVYILTLSRNNEIIFKSKIIKQE